jgi:hypothetical protein
MEGEFFFRRCNSYTIWLCFIVKTYITYTKCVCTNSCQSVNSIIFVTTHLRKPYINEVASNFKHMFALIINSTSTSDVHVDIWSWLVWKILILGFPWYKLIINYLPSYHNYMTLYGLRKCVVISYWQLDLRSKLNIVSQLCLVIASCCI